MRTLIMLGSGLMLGLISGQGCRYSETDPLHCANFDGDASCAARFPDGSRPFCRRGTDECYSSEAVAGCVEARPADECYSPCGGRSTISENGECLPDEDSSSGSSSGETETEESSGSSSESGSSTTGPMPCIDNEDCTEPGAPFCGTDGACGTCDAAADPNTACASVDDANPVCVDGACVQCAEGAVEACTGLTPICDVEANTCIGCTAHDECGEAACNLFTGACLPTGAVVHVGPGQTYGTLAEAVGSVGPGAEATLVVHQPMANYDEAVTVDGGRVLAFVAAEDVSAPPGWLLGGGGAPQLTVADGTVLLDGLRLSGNANDVGIAVNGGRAWVDRSRIVQNTGGGIVAQNAAELVLRNCFVGGDVNDIAALEVNGANANILYTTVGAGFGTATALACDGEATVQVRNSLLVARTTDEDEITCSATIEHSAAELDLGGTNTALGDMNTNWFVGYGTGDFSLSGVHPAAIDTAAEWTEGDPPTDIDGDPRPMAEGPDHAGADVP